MQDIIIPIELREVHLQKFRPLLYSIMEQEVGLAELAEFHARYESIHPFQDGNGRTGRIILFRECLKNGIAPVVIFRKEQEFYLEKCRYFME